MRHTSVAPNYIFLLGALKGNWRDSTPFGIKCVSFKYLKKFIVEFKQKKTTQRDPRICILKKALCIVWENKARG